MRERRPTWGRHSRKIEDRSGLQRAQIAEDLVRERVDVADLVRLADHAVRVDEVRDPLGEVDLVTPRVACAVLDTDLFVVVREQTEREVELLAERLVVGGCIEADAEDLARQRFELLGLVTQALSLNRSTGGISLRIPPQQDPTPALVGEPDGAALLIGHVEVGSGSAFGEHQTFAFSRMWTPHAEPSPMTCVSPTFAPSI